MVHVHYPRLLFANERSQLGSWHYYPGSATGFPAPCVNSCNTRSASAVDAMHNDLHGVGRILQEVSCWVCTAAPHVGLSRTVMPCGMVPSLGCIIPGMVPSLGCIIP